MPEGIEDAAGPLRRYYDRSAAKIRIENSNALLSPERLAAMRMRWEEEWGKVAARPYFKGKILGRAEYPCPVYIHELPRFIWERAREKGFLMRWIAEEGAIP